MHDAVDKHTLDKHTILKKVPIMDLPCMALRKMDYVGLKYARLTILTNPKKGDPDRKVDSVCDCGTVKIVRLDNVRKGCTRSCGCYRRENNPLVTHSLSKTSEYNVWAAMKKRCRNPTHKSYHHYGGRGIAYDDRWESFENFIADMGIRPSESHSLDRIDNSRGYSRENCHWATKKQQAQNRRNVVLFNGEPACSIAISKGISRSTFHKRLEYGWSVERALNTPINSHLKSNR